MRFRSHGTNGCQHVRHDLLKPSRFDGAADEQGGHDFVAARIMLETVEANERASGGQLDRVGFPVPGDMRV